MSVYAVEPCPQHGLDYKVKTCIECKRRYNRAYRAVNLDRIKAQQKAHRESRRNATDKCCPKCGDADPPSGFHPTNNYCRSCGHKATRAWEKRNPDKVRAQKSRQAKRRLALGRAWVLNYLKSHPCVDCGEADVVLLEFDHRDPATKRWNINRMLRNRFTVHQLAREVAKCDVRCANCHRRRTHIQHGGGYRGAA